jgi:hypothetical protein
MRHQLGEGEEVKKRKKKIAGRLTTGSQKNELASDALTDDEIDPADFFDPEEFGFGRRDLKFLEP